jgi:hypothetical protein
MGADKILRGMLATDIPNFKVRSLVRILDIAYENTILLVWGRRGIQICGKISRSTLLLNCTASNQ